MSMRLRFFTSLIVAAFAASCVDFICAEEADTHFVSELLADARNTRNLKSSTILTKEEQEALETNDEERVGWQSAVRKVKAVNRFKNAGVNGGVTTKLKEAEVQKITEKVAQEVAKKPGKWPVVKRILKITYGALLASLIIIGVDAMLSSA